MRMHLAVTTALLAACALPVGAITVTVDQTIDVADIVPGLSGFTGGAQGTPPFGPPFSVVLAEGDIFVFTIDFVGAQTLSVNNLSFIWAFSFADVSSNVTGTGSLALLDTAGVPIVSSLIKTTTEGEVHFGQQFDAGDFPGLPASITFGGLRYTGSVDDYVAPGVTQRNYNNPALFFNADSFVATIPEPGTWALWAAGLAAVAGCAARRRSA